MVLNGTLRLGELVAFVLYLATFFAPIQQLVQLYNTYQQGGAAITKLRDVFAEQPDPAESPTAHDLPPVEGDIKLEGVTFGYDPSASGAERRRPAHRARARPSRSSVPRGPGSRRS